MLSKPKLIELADRIVNYSMKIGQKENPAYSKARNRHSWLTGSFTIEQAMRKSGLTKKRVEEIIEKYSDVDYGPLLIKKGSKYHVKDKIGHSVLIFYNAATKSLKEEVERACWRNGAHTMSFDSSSKQLKDIYKFMPIDSIRELPSIQRAVRANIDYRIYLEALESSFWAKKIRLAKLKANAPPHQRIHEIEDKKNVRWVIVGWPHPETAKELGISLAKFKKIMFESIWCSFEKKTKQMIDRFHNSFKAPR